MAKAPKPSGCHDCRFVDKRGHRRGPWSCTFEVVLPPLPAAALCKTTLANAANAHKSMGMWPGEGTDCPVWSLDIEKETT